MSEPELDSKDNSDSGPDADVRTDTMFDFLAENDKRPAVRRPERGRSDERSMPIIRKPVPVSESGPLLPPKPGDPVEPPPQLTISKGDRSDFLGDGPPAKPSMSGFATQAEQRNVTQLKPGRSQPVPSDLDNRGDQYKSGEFQREDEPTLRDPFSREASSRMVAPREANPRKAAPTTQVRIKENPKATTNVLDLDDLDSDDEFDFDSDWNHDVHTNIFQTDEPKSLVRKRLFAVAVVLIAVGVGSFAFTQRAQWWQLMDSVGLEPEKATDPATSQVGDELEGIARQGDNTVAESGLDTELPEELPDVSFDITPSPLMKLFRDQLATLESLISKGSLDEAEQLLVDMDRAVYGYGAFEFAEIKGRIADIRNGAIVEPQNGDRAGGEDQLVQERLEQEAAEALRLEQDRQLQLSTEAEALRLEQERQAELDLKAEALRLEQETQAELDLKAEALRLEQERQAELDLEAEALRLEQERQAELDLEAEALRLEQERQAELDLEAEALRLEQERLVDSEFKAEAQRLEQERQSQLVAEADAQRLKQESQALAASEQDSENWQTVDADRQATDRRIAEQRAAAQRQEARDQRLAQARERADAQAKELQRQQAAAEAALLASAAESIASAIPPETTDSSNSSAIANQTITDDDIQIVYQRFSQLQQAVNTRDINAVIELTRRSGTRVQQFLQMFENSVSIDSRIRNVSTRSSSGEIRGTLQIRGITRADGSVIKPSASVASVSLSSRRDGSGWSIISW